MSLPGCDRRQILFLSRWFPYPPDNGARIRVINLLQALSACYTIDLISFVDSAPRSGDLDAVRSLCRHVNTARYATVDPGRFQTLQGLLSSKPRSVLATKSNEFASLVRQVMDQYQYDLIIASEIDMVPYVPPGTMPALLEEVELTTLFEQYRHADSALRRARFGLTWFKLRRYLARSLDRFAACTVVSEPELERLRDAVPSFKGQSAIIPNGVDVAHYEGFSATPKPATMIYSGAVTYRANYDAVDYFGREILPLIQEQRPDAHLVVTGDPGTVDIQPLLRPGISFAGYLPDVRPVIAQSWVSIIPLRLGGGTRLKLLEALAIGTPVVATPKGAEGLKMEAGRDLLIAETPAEFAAAVVRVLGDAQLRASLVDAGKQTVRAYDWSKIGNRLQTLVEDVIVRHNRSTQLQLEGEQ